MSETSRSGSGGKSVSATAVLPGVTTKRSSFPAASQRKAIFVPSGDHAGLVGYLIAEIRSMVMLPRGPSAAGRVTKASAHAATRTVDRVERSKAMDGSFGEVRVTGMIVRQRGRADRRRPWRSVRQPQECR